MDQAATEPGKSSSSSSSTDRLVREAKQCLTDAIEHESVDEVRTALRLLSVTSLARSMTGPNDDDGGDGGNRRCLRWNRILVDLDFNVCVRHPTASIHWTLGVLAAAIGPDPVHTDMVRCFLTPQTFHGDDEDDHLTFVVTTNAGETALPRSTCAVNTTGAKRPQDITALGLACSFGNVELAELLLEHGADPNRRIHGETPLYRFVVSSENHPPDSGANSYRRLVEILIRHGGDPNAPSKGWVPLPWACKNGDVALAEILLEHGADPRAPHLLTRACISGSCDLARLLLEHGADPNDCSNDGLTPLIRASRIGNLELVRLLLLPPHDTDDETTTLEEGNDDDYSFDRNRWGTDLCRYDQQSMNALMHACTENHEAVVRFLVSGGAYRQNNNNKSSLATRVARYVNDYKVDPALWYASAHGNAGIVRFLMDECGAKADYRKDPTMYSSTPLEEASQWGHAATVTILLARPGSDPRSPSGKAARTMAKKAGHSCVVGLLDAWRDRWTGLEGSSFSPGFLPMVLGRTVVPSTQYAILSNNAGTLMGREGCM